MVKRLQEILANASSSTSPLTFVHEHAPLKEVVTPREMANDWPETMVMLSADSGTHRGLHRALAYEKLREL